MKRAGASILLAFAVTAAMQSCFTGVESTPKITESDIKHQHAEMRTPESEYFDSVRHGAFSEWQKGKKFIVTDSRISLALDGANANDSTLVGRTLRFDRIQPYSSITGQNATEIVFTDSIGRTYVYRTNLSSDGIASRNRLEIPFTIEHSVVDKASKILDGKQLFLISPAVRTISGNLVNSPKFVAVVIDKVETGSQFYPVKVIFHYVDNPTIVRQVNLSIGDESNSRKFGNFFSFTDPRIRYPAISDEVWKNIVNNKADIGMTRDECRLALGAPRTTDKVPTRNGIVESWIYDSGTQLFFTDGLLTEIKK